LDLNESCPSKSSNKTSTIDSKSIKENSYVLEKNDGVSKKVLPRKRYSESTFARDEEVRMRRQQAERIVQARLRAGIMRNGESNFNANTSSQIGNTRIRDDERRYRESLRLPPILSHEDREILNISNTNINNLSPLEPRVNNNYNPLEPNVNNSQNNSQGNTNNYYTDNNQDRTNNSTSNSK
jgi:hypothetical protein